MRTRAKTLKLYALGIAVTIVGFFGVVELATRTVSWIRGDGFFLALHERDATDEAITEVYEFHPFTGFIFKPHNVFFAGHPAQEGTVRIETDGHGFLSPFPAATLEKAADEIRIATIGASTTANINLSYERNWPGRLAALVGEQLPHKRVTLINAAIPGFNTAQSVANLALRVMPLEPDVVIIYHAYNDLKAVRPGFEIAHDYRNLHERPYGQHDRPGILLRFVNKSMFYVRARNRYRELAKAKADLETVQGEGRLQAVTDRAASLFEHNVRTMVGCAKSGGAEVILSSFATLHDLDVGRLERTMTPLKQTELFSLLHFTPGLDLTGIFQGFSRYNAILAAVAQDEHTGWVDNADRIPHEDENFVDRVHFSAAGAELMAMNFLPEVMRVLQRRHENSRD